MPDLNTINQAVQGASSTSGVRNLSVRQNGSSFEVHGEANDIASKQQAFKAITSKVGDTAGLVNLIQVSSEKPAQQQAGGGRTHTVQRGETLSGIAQKYYGRASEYQKIFEANRDKLSDPDKVREGTNLVIPA
jgi:nucleoid-associated protein YgaU